MAQYYLKGNEISDFLYWPKTEKKSADFGNLWKRHFLHPKCVVNKET